MSSSRGRMKGDQSLLQTSSRRHYPLCQPLSHQWFSFLWVPLQMLHRAFEILYNCHHGIIIWALLQLFTAFGQLACMQPHCAVINNIKPHGSWQ